MKEIKEKEIEIHRTTYEGKESFCLILNWRGVHTEEETKQLKQQMLQDQEKAVLFDNLIPILRRELPEEQLKLFSVLIDPESRKLLVYLAKDSS